jgi:hypothetical protein
MSLQIGTVIQLTSVGPEDKFLTYQPEMSFFTNSVKPEYVEYENVHYDIPILENSSTFWGTKSVCNIKRTGTYLGNVSLYICVHDFSMTAQDFLLSNAYGPLELVDTVRFRVGEEVVDTLTSDHIFHLTVLKKMLHGMQGPDGKVYAIIPLPFWFCKWEANVKGHPRYPLYSLSLTTPCTIEVNWKAQGDCRLIYTDIEVSASVWVDEYLCTPNEINQLRALSTERELIVTHQHSLDDLVKNRIEIPFKGPCKQISWGVKEDIKGISIDLLKWNLKDDDIPLRLETSPENLTTLASAINESKQGRFARNTVLKHFTSGVPDHHFPLDRTLYDYMDPSQMRIFTPNANEEETNLYYQRVINGDISAIPSAESTVECFQHVRGLFDCGVACNHVFYCTVVPRGDTELTVTCKYYFPDASPIQGTDEVPILSITCEDRTIALYLQGGTRFVVRSNLVYYDTNIDISSLWTSIAVSFREDFLFFDFDSVTFIVVDVHFPTNSDYIITLGNHPIGTDVKSASSGIFSSPGPFVLQYAGLIPIQEVPVYVESSQFRVTYDTGQTNVRVYDSSGVLARTWTCQTPVVLAKERGTTLILAFANSLRVLDSSCQTIFENELFFSANVFDILLVGVRCYAVLTNGTRVVIDMNTFQIEAVVPPTAPTESVLHLVTRNGQPLLLSVGEYIQIESDIVSSTPGSTDDRCYFSWCEKNGNLFVSTGQYITCIGPNNQLLFQEHVLTEMIVHMFASTSYLYTLSIDSEDRLTLSNFDFTLHKNNSLFVSNLFLNPDVTLSTYEGVSLTPVSYFAPYSFPYSNKNIVFAPNGSEYLLYVEDNGGSLLIDPSGGILLQTNPNIIDFNTEPNITLPTPFSFFGTEYTILYPNERGNINFTGPNDSNMVNFTEDIKIVCMISPYVHPFIGFTCHYTEDFFTIVDVPPDITYKVTGEYVSLTYNLQSEVTSTFIPLVGYTGPFYKFQTCLYIDGPRKGQIVFSYLDSMPPVPVGQRTFIGISKGNGTTLNVFDDDQFLLNNTRVTYTPIDSQTFQWQTSNIVEFETIAGEPVLTGDGNPKPSVPNSPILVTLPTPFRFYGIDYSEVQIQYSQYISFGTSSDVCPLTSDQNVQYSWINTYPRVCALTSFEWTFASGGISYLLTDTKLIITWHGVYVQGSGDTGECQIELFLDGTNRISIAYLHIPMISPGLYFPIVGVQNGLGPFELVHFKQSVRYNEFKGFKSLWYRDPSNSYYRTQNPFWFDVDKLVLFGQHGQQYEKVKVLLRVESPPLLELFQEKNNTRLYKNDTICYVYDLRVYYYYTPEPSLVLLSSWTSSSIEWRVSFQNIEPTQWGLPDPIDIQWNDIFGNPLSTLVTSCTVEESTCYHIVFSREVQLGQLRSSLEIPDQLALFSVSIDMKIGDVWVPFYYKVGRVFETGTLDVLFYGNIDMGSYVPKPAEGPLFDSFELLDPGSALFNIEIGGFKVSNRPKESFYYQQVVPWYTNQTATKGLHRYSFAINPTDVVQPSGHYNMELNSNYLLSESAPRGKLLMFAETLNFMYTNQIVFNY